MPGYHWLSGPCWNSVTVHTKTVFSSSISKCLQKQNIKGSVFTVWGPAFLFFQPMHPILCFVMLKVPQSLKTLLIHTNDWPLFDVIENACTSCWEERGGGGGGKDGKADVANQLSWNGPTSPWGKKTVCLLSCWIALEEGERRTHVL